MWLLILFPSLGVKTDGLKLFQVTSYPWIKSFSAKTTRYVAKSWGRSVKRKSNLNFVWVIKNLWKFCIYLVPIFLKVLCWRFIVPHSQLLLVNCKTLSCKTRNILTLSMLVYYNMNSFCLILKVSYTLVCSSDCNWTRTQNHLVHKQTLNHGFTVKRVRDMTRTYN